MVYEQLIKNWAEISQLIINPTNDNELQQLIDLADYLIDHVGKDSSIEGLLDYIGSLIEDYESKQLQEPLGDPIEALKLLMSEHGLKQKDLSEIGSPGVISEIFNGKRELNKRQISALSARFNCSPAVFF